MHDSNQTPASRRFLPASSASRLQQSSSARKAQFAFPSQTTGSTSPLVYTPSTQQARRFDDDIEVTHSKPEPGSSSLFQSLTQTRRQYLNTHDYIEDDEGHSNENTYERTLLQSTVWRPKYDADHDWNAVLDASSSSPKPNFSSPLPKRQKTSHAYELGIDRIDVSSSPSPDAQDLSDYEDTAVAEANDTGMKDNNEVSCTKSRFRTKPILADDGRAHSPRQLARSVFKGTSAVGASWGETPLPATFSPSKRKGKYEYVHDGAAETVRNWILDIANDQSRETDMTQVLDITPTFTDSSGRFEVAHDRQGQAWMFVRQEGQSVALGQISGHREGAETRVVIKGSKTTWKVEAVTANQPASALQVAVLWDVEAGRGVKR